MPALADPNTWLTLLTLSALEVVLGVDNILMIALLSGRLPAERQARARRLGLTGAFFTRVAFLLSITWIMRLTRPLLTVGPAAFSGRELILAAGGVFLVFKGGRELFAAVEHRGGGPDRDTARGAAGSVLRVVSAIMLVDVVFSIDSVITAVGLADNVVVMIAANVVALAVMLGLAGPLAGFIEAHPTVKVLALAFLVLIGIELVAEGIGLGFSKTYIYAALGFSTLVELLNLRMRRTARSAARVSPPSAPSPPLPDRTDA